MKAWPIKDKVIKLMGFKRDKQNIERMQRDREIARIGNEISQNIDIICEEYKRKLVTTVHHILKSELK
jgi:hypothetical protein